MGAHYLPSYLLTPSAFPVLSGYMSFTEYGCSCCSCCTSHSVLHLYHLSTASSLP